MSEAPIRVGIVGAGANTKLRHLPGLKAQPGVELAGVANRSRESAEKGAREFGIGRVFDRWQDLVEDPAIDAVVIGTWPYLHCPVTLAALAAGKHVLTEARMAMDAAEARRMRDAARAKPDLVAQVVPSPMTLEFDRTIRRLVSTGFFGELLAIEIHHAGGFLDRDAPLHWRQDVELSGLNVQMLGIWYEAVLRWAGEAVSVIAKGKTFVKLRRGADGGAARAVRVPEHLDVVADMACGAQLHIQQSAVAAFLQGGGAYIFGADGMLRFFDGKLYAARRGEKSLEEIAIPPAERIGWRVEEEFVNAIRGKEKVERTSFDDGVRYMEFTEAVARSMASGRAVALPLALDSP